MNHRYLFLLLLIYFSACKPGRPDDVLPPKKMQSAMWDIMRADEMASYYTTHDSSAAVKNKRARFYGEVFRVQGITQEDFKRSLRYYEGHPDLFKEVLDSLQSQGERAQKLTDTSHKSYPIPVDSSRSRMIIPPADSMKIKTRRMQKSLSRRKKLTV
jgi:hypothetical protein